MPKLTEAQASQAVDPVLKQIGQTTDADALKALAQALQALPATEAQAGQALGRPQAARLRSPGGSQPLAQALQALAAKLSEAQASQALDPVLKQIGQTTGLSSRSRRWRQALQWLLPAKLTEAQASQALENTLLKRIDQTTDP